MALTPGTHLGQYEILSAIGAGGMGEVYRAKDSKLGREVALKVLHQAVAQDAERLARFEREARALAALNHPNIVTIFAVEEAGGTRFLTMELVEGETLDTVIASAVFPSCGSSRSACRSPRRCRRPTSAASCTGT